MEGLRRRKAIEKPEITNLPPPLSPTEEARVMENLSSGDETRIKEAKAALIMNSQRFVMFIARRFFRPGAAYPFGNLDDLFSIGLIGLTKAANTFDLSRGKIFLTYAGHCIENEIMMEKRRATRRLKALGSVGSLDEEIEVEDGRMALGSQVPDSKNDTEGSFLGREEEAEKRKLLTSYCWTRRKSKKSH
jgi:RNA polymerase sporulation-specific sigma factor